MGMKTSCLDMASMLPAARGALRRRGLTNGQRPVAFQGRCFGAWRRRIVWVDASYPVEGAPWFSVEPDAQAPRVGRQRAGGEDRPEPRERSDRQDDDAHDHRQPWTRGSLGLVVLAGLDPNAREPSKQIHHGQD